MSPTGSEDWLRLAEQNKLTDSDIADITKRLDKMDASSDAGPWTLRTLQLIAEQPGIVSTVLARQMNFDRYAFKAFVVKLKELGLTYGLDVGYAISPRGRAFLAKRNA
ncbi:MAG: hypothetical protein WD646_12300 [Actinomycetota bacterium]